MYDFVSAVEKELTEIMSVMEEVDRKLQKIMPGKLVIKHRKSGDLYYELVKEGEGTRLRKIGREDALRVREIKNFHYFSGLRRRLRTNCGILERVKNSYIAYDPFSINENLPKVYRVSAEDYLDFKQWQKAEGDLRTKLWLERPYFKNDYPMPAYPCKTHDGTVVRSLGEASIYNMLQAYGVPFRYDSEIYLTDEKGNVVTRYPDFVIFLSDGSVLYWEHVGMMELDSYGESFLKKLRLYNQNGIVMGDNLILTASGPKGAINLAAVDRIIRERVLPYVSVQKTDPET